MKKYLLIATAFILSAGSACAQNAKFETLKPSQQVLQKSNNASLQATPRKAPRKIELGENQLIMGAYTSDALCQSGYGLGVTGVPGQLKAAVFLPIDQVLPFDGGKVVKFRVGLDSATPIANAFIYGISQSGNIEEIITADFSGNAKKGWNEVTPKEPFTLNLSSYQGVLMGYEYKQTASNYPISTVDEGTPYELFIFGNLGQGENWYNMGADYGNLSVQAIVENENFEAINVILDKMTLSSNYFQSGEDISYAVALHNFGTGTVSSYKLNVELDGTPFETLEGEELPSLEMKTIKADTPLPENLERGTHTLTVKLAEVDGVAVEEEQSLSSSFYAYEESVPRQKNLIEQFTSQYCTYCPRGVTFFSDLMKKRDDITWVSIHGNMNGTDIFRINECDQIMSYLGVTGYPSAAYNRTFVPDLAEGNEIVYGLGYDMSYRTQVVNMLSEVIDETAKVPSFVTLTLNPEANASTRELTFTVEGAGVNEAAEVLNGYGLYALLTENGIVAKQLNEGKWVQEFTHHYVLRKMFTKTTGDEITWDGDNFSKEFTYTIPDGFNIENLQVVAFVAPIVNLSNIDVMNMAVNNCESADVIVNTPSGITEMSNDNNAEYMHYSLSGMLLTAPQKGVNIVRMADGRVVKTLVK